MIVSLLSPSVTVSVTFVTSANAFFLILQTVKFTAFFCLRNPRNSITLRLWILRLQSTDTELGCGSSHHDSSPAITFWPGDTALCLSASEKPCLSPAGHFQFCCVPFKGNETAESRNGSESQLILLLSGRRRDLLSLLQARCFLIYWLWAFTYYHFVKVFPASHSVNLSLESQNAKNSIYVFQKSFILDWKKKSTVILEKDII